MTGYDADKEDTTIYKVLVNHEEQYSIWPEYKENPPGWADVGRAGPRAECLEYIGEVWSDLRPLSLRKKMLELNEDPLPPPPANRERPHGKSLVDRLCEGDHPVQVGLRPDSSVERFKEALDRNYIHIRFTNTGGGTELGFRLDRDSCDLSGADFESGAGAIHVEGGLTLDYVKARCIADIDLKTLQGKGRLVKADQGRESNPQEATGTRSAMSAGLNPTT